jgi:hypothetical protein
MNILEAMADLALFVTLALGPFLGRPTSMPPYPFLTSVAAIVCPPPGRAGPTNVTS